ncbi:hypothetical protein BC828DRAFT_385235 [Blastocladiella britannica]|nr:hypothetical protein BC828DRAFT_385235 [Blastocladiella britannica]
MAVDLTLDFWRCASRLATASHGTAAPDRPPPIPPIPPDLPTAPPHHDDDEKDATSTRLLAVPGTGGGIRRRSSVAQDGAALAIPRLVRRHSASAPHPSPLASSGAGSEFMLTGGESGRHFSKQPARDLFLVDANGIMNDVAAFAAYMAMIRKPYLGLLVATNPTSSSATTSVLPVMGFQLPLYRENLAAEQRHAVDQQAALLLGQIRGRIKRLEAEVDRDRAQLPRLAPDTPRTADQMHREWLLTHYASMTWVLNQQLFKLSGSHRAMHDRRIERDLEVLALDMPSRSELAPLHDDTESLVPQLRHRGGTSSSLGLDRASHSAATSLLGTDASSMGSSSMRDEEDADADAAVGGSTAINPRLLQQLEAENQALLAQFTSTLSEVNQAETSLVTIAQLQTELAQHMAVQQSQIESLVDDAAFALDNVEAGNVQLVKAREYGANARYWFLFIMLVVSGTLLFLDWYAG